MQKNQIAANNGEGVVISHGGRVALTDNVVQGNTGPAVRVDKGSWCAARGNDLRGNRGGAWKLPFLGRAKIQRSDNLG